MEVERPNRMAPPQLIDGDDQKRWAVCPQANELTSGPVWFPSVEAASAYHDEILSPATIHGAILPSPRAVQVPDKWLDWLMQGTTVVGPFCGIRFDVGGRARVPVKKVPRVDSCGHEWVVLERVDGSEWPLLVDEDGNELNGGIGAYRKCDEGESDLPFPPGYCAESRRSDRERLEIVPVKWLRDLGGPPYGGMGFSDYLPADEFVGRPGSSFGKADEIAAEIAEALERGFPDITCELGDDWQFKTIEGEALDQPAYRFKTRDIKSQAYQLALIARALEETLSRHRPALSADAVAAFWTSWSVWNHLWNWSVKISDELNRRRVPSDDATQISYALQHQVWSFGRMVCARCTVDAHLEGGKAKPLWARNLAALKLESGLSYRKIARLIGPGNGDHKAVYGHCKGLRVPEDHTIAEYAQAFSKSLGRGITADQIRNEDLTAPQTDSIT